MSGFEPEECRRTTTIRPIVDRRGIEPQLHHVMPIGGESGTRTRMLLSNSFILNGIRTDIYCRVY